MKIVVALLNNLPSLVLVLFLGAVLWRYGDQLIDQLKRVNKVGLLGVEVELQQVRKQLQIAAGSYEHMIAPERLKIIVKRAEEMQEVLNGAHILWVDDTPLANANIYRFLNSFGIIVDSTQSTHEAVQAIRWASSAFHIVVSDMHRAGEDNAGLNLITGIKLYDPDKPILLFVAKLDPDPTPEGADIITNRVDDLVEAIFSAIVKARTA